MMTMLVATLGLLPAALSHDIGSDSQRPFAIVIVGGLISDLLLSIFLLPTFYVWIASEQAIMAQLAKVQSLSDLRQVLGYESVSTDYDVAGLFEYQPVKGNLEDLQLKALQNRPDLRAAQQGVTAANSQLTLQKAIGKQDVTVQGSYSHVNGINAATIYGSIPLPIFNRNQGEIARARFAVTQAQELEKGANGQALTDVYDAYQGLRSNDKVVSLYLSTYLDVATRSRDISEYAYRHGGTSLLTFLDAERNYRATQLAYRQALASYLLALEQLRQAVGTRALP
jgi:outer membrane protein, heavy metal efflux system